MNPEFQRYLWLELSAHRLVATPLVLALVFGFLHLLSGWENGQIFAVTGWVLAAAIGVLWGARSAADAVVGEVREGTWDQQRLSSHGSWSLTWAKLAGAPVFSWYAALPCLALMIVGVSAGGMSPVTAFGHALLLITVVVFSHAVGLLTSLYLAAGGGSGLGRAAGGLHFVGLICALPMLGLAWEGYMGGWQGSLTWFHATFAKGPFVVASVATFTGWAVIGCYRLMRTELQLRNAPWVWLAFSLFLMGYFAGFTWNDGVVAGDHVQVQWPMLGTVSAVTAHATALGLGYFSLFSQVKDPVALRRLFGDLSAGAIGHALEVLPRWIWTLPLGSLTVAWAVGAGGGVVVCVSSLLFFARDAGLVMLLNLSPKRGRADMAALLYLVVLYALLPGIIEAGGMLSTDGWLRPMVDGPVALAVVLAAPQVVVVWFFVVLRWRRVWQVPQ